MQERYCQPNWGSTGMCRGMGSSGYGPLSKQPPAQLQSHHFENQANYNGEIETENAMIFFFSS